MGRNPLARPFAEPLTDQGVQHLRVGRTADGRAMVQLRIQEPGGVVDALIQETAGRVTIRLGGEAEERLLQRVSASLEDIGHEVALGSDADPQPRHGGEADPEGTPLQRPSKARRSGVAPPCPVGTATENRAPSSLPTSQNHIVDYRS